MRRTKSGEGSGVPATGFRYATVGSPRHGPTRTRSRPHSSSLVLSVTLTPLGGYGPGRGYRRHVVVLLETHDAYLDHDPGFRHPERADRLRAVRAGAEAAG